jgi:thiosulfate/3-mercaptopyruvate sulfurtransferase
MKTPMQWVRIVVALSFLAAAPAAVAGALVTVEWLQKNIAGGDILLIDASGTKAYSTKHIPGAVGVDLWRYGVPFNVPAAEMEKRIQSWGVEPGKKVVVYDQGGDQMATWLFYELYYHGFPEGDLHVLDGGLAKWEASGGAVTKEPTSPKPGTFKVTKVREEVRARLNEFVTATGDTKNYAVVEALEPTYHYGGTQWFDRAGHVPNARMMPSGDFFNADKTFKSAEEIRRMASYVGIKDGQTINSHCGGGIAATVPFFALKFVSAYPDVKVYRESQLEWLQDERGLPMWTYDAPGMKRDAQWLQSWNSRMIRMYGVGRIAILDVRSPEAYAQSHVPYSVNVPADVFRTSLNDPQKLAPVLGAAGVDAGYEAVIVSGGGLDPSAALAYVALERLGQKKVSVLMESTDDYALRGYPIAKEPTTVGAPKSPQDLAVRPAVYTPNPRADIAVADARSTRGAYPKVFLASGSKLPAKAQDGKVVHVPYTDLLGANRMPKPAAEIHNILAKAGLPRYAEIIVVADDPGEAAVNYYIMKLMGYPDVKVLL